jgi:hypothetical protein
LLTELALQTDKGIVLASTLIEHLRQQSVICRAQRRRAGERRSHHPRQPAHLRCLGRTAVDRASPPPRRSAQASGQRQNDLAGLAAIARQTDSRHMLEHIERLKAWQALDLPSGIERRCTRTACSRSPARVAR